jgi:hypothetical protein
MAVSLSPDQVASLAPDAASLSAGKKLANGRVWLRTGCDDRAIWGECQGSALYQTRVDLTDLTAKCSCPSRKFPCKHALGLLLLAAASPAAVPDGPAPQWVTEWLDKRGAAAQRKEAKAAAQADKPVDEKAQARRAEQRARRVEDGLESLEVWITDLVRNGLGQAATQGPGLWETQAARMVDAQAPGIGSRLRRLGDHPRNAADWSRRVLAGLGRIELLIEAFRRLDTLDPALQDDVRSLIGWTLKEDEVTARGTPVDDRWWVVGQRDDEDERLRVQRSWLLGIATGRYALVLQFAVGQAPFPTNLIPGTVLDARLRYWPSAAPLRAQIEDRRGTAEPWSGEARGYATLDAMLAAHAAALAANPWADRLPCLLQSVRPARHRGDWHVVDASGQALPLATSQNWKLLAVSGGHPIGFAGEWDGAELLPLAAIVDGRYETLSR